MHICVDCQKIKAETEFYYKMTRGKPTRTVRCKACYAHRYNAAARENARRSRAGRAADRYPVIPTGYELCDRAGELVGYATRTVRDFLRKRGLPWLRGPGNRIYVQVEWLKGYAAR